MSKGRCCWFSSGKGYGFVEDIATHKEFFVHHSHILMDGYRKLDQGDEVEFTINPEGLNGRPQAEQVRVIRKAVA